MNAQDKTDARQILEAVYIFCPLKLHTMKTALPSCMAG